MTDEENSEEIEEVENRDTGEILSSTLVEVDDAKKSQEADSSATDSFDAQLERTLRETEEAVIGGVKEVGADPNQSHSWSEARKIVTQFKPVPSFIWRLSNFVLGRPGHIGTVSEGLVFGLRRLMFAVGSDEALGAGEKVTSVRKAIRIVPSDVIASASVIHAVCRRLASKEHERIWNPILDDALLRARIGHSVGMFCESFGSGRGMLAGFAGRSGLAVLISLGDLDQARRALELLATGHTIKEAGFAVYQCDPLQVSAMMLTAAGVGRDAAFGTVNFSLGGKIEDLPTEEQKLWLSAFEIVENVRMNTAQEINPLAWDLMCFEEEDQEELVRSTKKLVRRGHGWQWMM